MKNFLIVFAFAVIAFSSCKKENTAPTSNVSGQEYFPLYQNFERYYHVDSIAWDKFTNTVDTTSYEVKEVIGETYLDNENRQTQKIYRYRKDSFGNWIIWKVWAMNRYATRGEQVEDNVRLVKIQFAPTLNLKWNGNDFNTLDAQEYRITHIAASDQIDTLTYFSTLTVTQQDDDNLSERHQSEERYEANIGLYYRKNVNQVKVFGTENIESGYIYTEILIGHSAIPLPDVTKKNPD